MIENGENSEERKERRELGEQEIDTQIIFDLLKSVEENTDCMESGEDRERAHLHQTFQLF